MSRHGTTVKRRVKQREGGPLSGVACEAYLQLILREHGPRSLARTLGVTVAILGDILAPVERKFADDGIKLRIVRRSRLSRYRLRGEAADLRRAWRGFIHSLKGVQSTPP
jgi:hypothetical protein